jgi:putative transposase
LKIERKCFKLKTKVLNIIKDFQWKVSSFLCKTYKVVLLPIFKSQELKNNLNRKNNRLLDLLSHYKFQEKMKHQAIKYNCDLKIVTEEYTTKTCGKCGCINNFIGSSKIFWCNKCNVTLERDYQAARNILIKFKCQGSDAYPLRGT